MANKPKEKNIRVGLLVSGALFVLMLFVFFIGSEQKIFARKNEYEVRFDSVAGLAEGNPVKISGVTVGVVKDIRLPRDPKQRDVVIQLMVDRKFSERIRGDSRARLKKLGLLAGDSYVDITPGSPRFPMVEPGAIIPAQRQTNVDQLISSGEDVVDNLVQISYSMKNILGRVDRGEGLIGELTTAPDTKQRITDTFLTTLNKTNAALGHIESGKGVVGKLLYDDRYAQQLTGALAQTVGSLQIVSANIQKSFDTGSGALPALLSDPEGKKRVLELAENLRVASGNLAVFSESLKNGQGMVPRLLNDKQFGDQALSEFTLLVHQLNETVAKINSGHGTAGKLVSDPSVYESINDILIGINESKLLRWLIRSRQQSGIEKRYEEQKKAVPQVPPAEGTMTTTVTTTAVTTTTTAPPPPALPVTPADGAPTTSTQPPVAEPPSSVAPPTTSTQPAVPPTSTQPPP